MRFLLTILLILSIIPVFSQSPGDKYLHFRTDYYWDTILYKSEQDFYFEKKNSNIVRKEYPVLHYLYTKIISDTPEVTKDTFELRAWSGYPYKYIKKGDIIYLQYFDHGERKLKLHKEYSLNRKDTVKWLANKFSLDSKYGISVSGFSTYLGEETIRINDKQFKTFRFLKDHDERGVHSSYYTEDVFLDQSTLIPLKFITTQYDFKSRQKDLYSSVTMLTSSSMSLPNYTNKKADELILYQDTTKVWTEKQKQIFISMFSADWKKFGECLLNKLNGQISFFHFERNILYRRLLIDKECE